MAAFWTVVPDLLLTEVNEWTLVNNENTLIRDGTSWTAKPSALSPGAANNLTISNFGGWAVEELHVLVEDLEIDVEEIQNDHNDWTILAEPV